MKTILTGFMLIGLLCGCATTQSDRLEQIEQSLHDARTDVVLANQQIAKTMDTLDQIQAAGSAELSGMYTELVRDSKQIEQYADSARYRANAYRARLEDYLDAWQAELPQIEDAVTRVKSSQRKSAVLAMFHDLEFAAENTRQAYGPLVIQLQGIVRTLESDLTPSGVKNLEPKIANARIVSSVLQQRIENVLNRLDVMSATLISQLP